MWYAMLFHILVYDVANAGEIQRVFGCSKLLSIDRIATSETILRRALGPDLIEIQPVALSDNLVKLSHPVGARHFNLETLRWTSIRPVSEIASGKFTYREVVKCPTGRMSVFARTNGGMTSLTLVAESNIELGLPLFSKNTIADLANVGYVLFSPNDDFLALNLKGCRTISVIDLQTGLKRDEYTADDEIVWAEWSRDGGALLAVNAGRKGLDLIRFDLESGILRSLLVGLDDYYGRKVFVEYLRQIGKIVLATEMGNQAKVFVIDEHDGRGQVSNFPETVLGMRPSNDGRYFLIRGTSTIYIYTTESLAVRGEISYAYGNGKVSPLYAAFNTDSQVVVICSDNTVNTFNVK
jgi:WD40 repeat protein